MDSRYDRAVTIFSPDGHLLQVEYAQEAVRRGSTAVGVVGAGCVVLGVEKKAVPLLQDERTVRKICQIDKHIILAFAGLTADARVLVNRVRVECQTHQLNLEDPVKVEYITRFIAGLKQKYTQSNGRRPFGISCLIGGFDRDGTARLFQTEPSGVFYEWKANATGRSAQTVREFLEKEYDKTHISCKEDIIKLAIRALLEVVQGDQKNLEIAVMVRGQPLKTLNSKEIDQYVTVIVREKEIEAERKRMQTQMI